jgi:succinate-semialdehyde dehydrogenase/glutarate-semialdehyde dehydrogenase
MGTSIAVSFTTVNPSTGRAIESFSYLESRELDRRLDTAVAAQRAWRESSLADRSALFAAIASKLRGERDVLATAAVDEMGKPFAQARSEVEKCAVACDYFAEHLAELVADIPLESSGAVTCFAAVRPLGVILAVMPWNYPYWQFFRAAIPALCIGNGVALKHAEPTTRCALEIERVVGAAGAPRGLVSTLLVSNEEADARIADPRIAAVTLTGSERAGVAVGAAAGAALKKCVLELGGSDAFVVLADADLEAAARTAVTARFQNNGQSCIAAKRFIVEAAVHDAFLEAFVRGAAAQLVGDPHDLATAIGPCARADLRNTLHEQVRATIARGARLVVGGSALDRDGFFYEPTIVSEVIPGMRMFDEEVFGPAAAVVRARHVDEAIALANASSFGLGASIWSNDLGRASELAARVEAGMVFVNGLVASDPRLPFGGVKKSGHGRELSIFGIREFANLQTVCVAAAPKHA